jgi:hypothetical protein
MYGMWFAAPAIYGDLTGLDRIQAERAAMAVLLEMVAEGAAPGGAGNHEEPRARAV